MPRLPDRPTLKPLSVTAQVTPRPLLKPLRMPVPSSPPPKTAELPTNSRPTAAKSIRLPVEPARNTTALTLPNLRRDEVGGGAATLPQGRPVRNRARMPLEAPSRPQEALGSLSLPRSGSARARGLSVPVTSTPQKQPQDVAALLAEILRVLKEDRAEFALAAPSPINLGRNLWGDR